MSNKISRFLKIDYRKLRASRQGLPLFVDILMINLVILNLGLIFFDWSYNFNSFQALIHWILPGFDAYYIKNIHPNASYYDLIFVSIFILELLIRWMISIYRKEYDKWFFYPVYHWYDVLGCIPMSGTFKLFRLMRILGMTLRLNNLGIIDIKSTFIYKKLNKYSKIVIEEISDKVVTNVLSGVQQEIQKDNPVIQKIATQVIIPQEGKINEWLNNKIVEALIQVYYKHREGLYTYLQGVVNKSVHENPEIKRISLIPGVGKLIADALDSSISNITFNVVDNSIEEISKSRQIPAMEDITSYIFNQFSSETENTELNELMKSMTFDTIEIVKKYVEIKLWRLKELNEEKSQLLQRLKEGRGNKNMIETRINVIDEQIKKISMS
ncbi:MAG: hypothetical protein M9887_07160 [Chitinophagales bacterium]|nr:hypothetical protein [Chitinophagales bacterium]